MFLRTAFTGAVAAALAATVALAGSHSSEPAAVKARKAQMQLHSFNLGILGNMVKGDVEFDAEAAQGAADRLVALTGYGWGAYFPEGTSNFDIEGTRALPAIWDNPDGVNEEREKLHAAAMALAENAGTLDGLKANFGAVGGSCGSCHEKFRAPNN